MFAGITNPDLLAGLSVESGGLVVLLQCLYHPHPRLHLVSRGGGQVVGASLCVHLKHVRLRAAAGGGARGEARGGARGVARERNMKGYSNEMCVKKTYFLWQIMTLSILSIGTLWIGCGLEEDIEIKYIGIRVGIGIGIRV